MSKFLDEKGYAVSYFYVSRTAILLHLFVPSDWIVMDILREFLESSTIHGLTYISTARVRLVWCSLFLLQYMLFLADKDCKDFLGWSCMSWVHRSWDPDWQVLLFLAGKSNNHVYHYPSHRRPWLPRCNNLPSKELQHSSLSWPRQCWQ